jgi:hypothetical protein
MIAWWEKIILWFIKEQHIELDYDGIKTVLYFKAWRHRVYVTDIIKSFTIGEFIL